MTEKSSAIPLQSHLDAMSLSLTPAIISRSMTTELNQGHYLQTMTSGMVDVSDIAKADTDIWAYVAVLVKDKIILPYVLKKQLVEKVYRSKDEKYDHVVLPTDDKNHFVVLIVDRVAKNIQGHFLLDLEQPSALYNSHIRYTTKIIYAVHEISP
jgi:hypothetical protein